MKRVCARAQSGATFLDKFLANGARYFRAELLEEDASKTESIVRSYRELLYGRVAANELDHQLKVANQLGVTSGALTALAPERREHRDQS